MRAFIVAHPWLTFSIAVLLYSLIHFLMKITVESPHISHFFPKRRKP